MLSAGRRGKLALTGPVAAPMIARPADSTPHCRCRQSTGISPCCRTHCALSLLSVTIATTAAAQDVPTVRPCKRRRSPATQSAAAPQTVQFGRQGPRVGDQVEQKIALEMRLATSLRQGNKLLEKNETTMRNTQRRAVTTTEVARRSHAGRAGSLSGSHQADDHRHGCEQGAPTAKRRTSIRPVPQPVQGKAYRCRREPGDDGKLTVTDDRRTDSAARRVRHRRAEHGDGRPAQSARRISRRPQGRRRRDARSCRKTWPTGCSVSANDSATCRGSISRCEEVRDENGRTCAAFRASVDAARTSRRRCGCRSKGRS